MERHQNQALTKPQAMVFDMDGTLFKTETLLIPVYHGVFDRLREEGLYQGETPPQEIFLGCLGMLLSDIWQKVIPNEEQHVHRRADELLLELELKGLKELESDLYPEVASTLLKLKEQGVALFVASNGLEHYVKGVAEAHRITELFGGIYSAGEYQTLSKVDLVKILLDRHELDRIWMVGDRSSDVEAGKKNGQTVIGCDYAGFGQGEELRGSDVIIHDFTELLQLYNEALEVSE